MAEREFVEPYNPETDNQIPPEPADTDPVFTSPEPGQPGSFWVSNSTSPTPKLDVRMSKMLTVLGTKPLAKRGKVQGARMSFKYVTAADINNVVREALGECGIALYISERKVTWLNHPYRPRIPGAPASAGGGRTCEVELDVTFSAEGEQRTLPARAEGWDEYDGAKSIAKARTYALKYFFTAMFCLSPDEEIDDEGAVEPAQQQPQQQTKSRGRQAKPKPAEEDAPAMTADTWALLDGLLKTYVNREQVEVSMCETFGVDNVESLSEAQAQDAIETIEKRKASRGRQAES